MNKEEQIKEMLLAIPQKIVAYDMNPKGQHLYGEQRQQIAEALYNVGYRKVPNGAVILTPEERDEELKACNEKQAELEAEIELLKAENTKLGISLEATVEVAHNLRIENNKRLKANEAFATKHCYMKCEIAKTLVKKFAERLKEKFGDYEVWHYNGNEEGWHDLKQEIDEYVKEFTE